MQEILYINNEEVDYIPNTIDRTIQINDLGNVENRESSYSQTIKLPRTAKNQRIFNFLGVNGSTSRVPYIQVPVQYSVDGIFLISDGYGVVKSTNQYYELVIYDGVIDLAEKLKNKTLSDLNYSDLNHYLTVENFFNSFENTEGYIYALGLFGAAQQPNQIHRQVPSLFVHTIWDKIFSEINVNYYGDFFTNEDFLSEVITPNAGYEVQDIEPDLNIIGSFDTDLVFESIQSPDMILGEDKIVFPKTTFNHSDVDFIEDGKLLFNKSMRIELDINASYSSHEGFNTFQVHLNGVSVRTQRLERDQNNFNLKLNISVEAGDTIQFITRGTDTGFDGEDQQRYYVNYNLSASISIYEALGGFLIDFNQIMGDMSQIDFIKDVMNRYGLILKQIDGNNYEFIQIDKLLTNKSNDWSDKLSTISNESYSNDYGRINTAEYSYPEEIKNKPYDGQLIIDNENLEPTKTLFKSVYTIPERRLRLWHNKPIYIHEVWEEDDDEVKTKDSEYKLFRLDYGNVNTPFYFFTDSNSNSYNGLAPFLSLNNTGLQYYIDNYYNVFNEVMNSYKEVEAEFYLNILDISTLNLFELIYLKQTGKYYYINEIKHNAFSKVSKVKLIELTWQKL